MRHLIYFPPFATHLAEFSQLGPYAWRGLSLRWD